jgi:hypothetical protein
VHVVGGEEVRTSPAAVPAASTETCVHASDHEAEQPKEERDDEDEPQEVGGKTESAEQGEDE